MPPSARRRERISLCWVYGDRSRHIPSLIKSKAPRREKWGGVGVGRSTCTNAWWARSTLDSPRSPLDFIKRPLEECQRIEYTLPGWAIIAPCPLHYYRYYRAMEPAMCIPVRTDTPYDKGGINEAILAA